jgi:hypothetical protein
MMDKIIQDVLERPFEAQQIKQRQGSFGKTLDYIEGHEVIKRLQEAFKGDFSFSVVEWKSLEDEVVVLGELTACGLTKSAFGNKKVGRNTTDKSIISIGDDIKSAATDSLKVCAKLFGVGLHLYGDKVNPAKEEQKKEEHKGNGNGSNGGNGFNATNAQISAIVSLSKQHGINNKSMANLLKEIGNVGAIEHLTKSKASLMIQHLKSMAA